MLQNNYGEIIIKEGSIIYHTSDDDEPFQYRYDKAFLFCIIHPSELYYRDEYVTLNKLKKDVSLLFMIEDCKKLKILSSLNILTNHTYLTSAKLKKEQFVSYVEELKKENFDGWFTSIDNRAAVEIALINDKNIFDVIKTEKLNPYWRRGYYNNDTIVIKDWRTKYPVCCIEKPVILNIHNRFEIMIQKYLEVEVESGFIKEYTFQVLLDNAIIKYHEGSLEKIEWKHI